MTISPAKYTIYNISAIHVFPLHSRIPTIPSNRVAGKHNTWWTLLFSYSRWYLIQKFKYLSEKYKEIRDARTAYMCQNVINR